MENLYHIHGSHIQNKPICRFEDDTFDWFMTEEDVLVAIKRSGTQFLADYQGKVCRLIFRNIRPYQVQVEGVFFQYGSDAWRALLSNRPEMEHNSRRQGIVLQLSEEAVEILADQINEEFQGYIEGLRHGDKRIVVSETGLTASDPSDAILSRHLLFEPFIQQGKLYYMGAQDYLWARQSVGSDVTEAAVHALDWIMSLPSIVDSMDIVPDTMMVLAHECNDCKTAWMFGKLEKDRLVHHLTAEEFQIAERALKAVKKQKPTPDGVHVSILYNLPCGCEEE